jgi:hypothetical protein
MAGEKEGWVKPIASMPQISRTVGAGLYDACPRLRGWFSSGAERLNGLLQMTRASIAVARMNLGNKTVAF